MQERRLWDAVDAMVAAYYIGCLVNRQRVDLGGVVLGDPGDQKWLSGKPPLRARPQSGNGTLSDIKRAPQTGLELAG